MRPFGGDSAYVAPTLTLAGRLRHLRDRFVGVFDTIGSATKYISGTLTLSWAEDDVRNVFGFEIGWGGFLIWVNEHGADNYGNYRTGYSFALGVEWPVFFRVWFGRWYWYQGGTISRMGRVN